MYLKSLKLTGFKSFADRSHLEFRPGVTVVVGPNGSGKSNLVDALSWVLGSQSPKSLRTPKMEDVIFAGTATRPSLNRAEVVLVIDNADRVIDLDLDEVSITRRLYRDGSSDYELNGVGCRLLDIQDLLADSGVGRHQHVIIGQGEIGHVLSATPEDHRAVIEEAAGILKHRRRKERAERRLERTDDDLLRLQDILTEITRQMRPLRRQARAAQKYQGIKDEVVALRLHLGGRQLAEYDRELTVATSERARLLESLEAEQEGSEGARARLAELEESLAGDIAGLDLATTAAALLETVGERLRRIASVAEERRRAASGRLEATEARILDLRAEMDEIDVEIAGLGDAIDGMTLAAEAYESKFRALEDEERALATQSSLSPEGAMAAVRGEQSAVEAALYRDRRELDSLDHRLEVLRSQVESETGAITDINTEIRSLDSAVSGLQADYDEAARSRVSDQEAWSSAERSLTEARLRVASAEARVEAIEAALSGRLDEEARSMVESDLGALGRLVGLLDVPTGLEAAVAAALGRWVDAVAFSDRGSLRQIVGKVKGTGGGAVSVVSPTTGESVPAREIAGRLGLEPLVDLLGPAASAPLADSLLGDVIMVEGWVAGWEVVDSHPEVRVVTPEGDLITAQGVHLASPGGASPVMLENARLSLERAGVEEARAVSIHTSAKRRFDLSREQERSCLEALESAETGLAGRTEAMMRLKRSVTAVETDIRRLEERRTALVSALVSAESHLAELGARIESLHGEEADLVRAWGDLEARRRQIVSERERARSQWQEAAGLLRAATERSSMLTTRRGRILVEMERLGTGPEGTTDPDTLATVESVARQAVDLLGAKLAILRDRQAGLRETTSRLREDLAGARAEEDDRRRAMTVARERVAQLDTKLVELRMHREAVTEAIRRDADANIEAAYRAPTPHIPEGTDPEELLRTRLAELTRLGPINPLAAAEYRDLEERHDFLVSQMSDVEQSRAELRKVINALDEEIARRFHDAFDEVATSFDRYFSVLFPGGRGRIRLVDTADPESGVSIDAQPMGKKVSQLSLLSGGERSLAALAFLFAIFEARPSPFYVLDEVEAALDDVNLRRFLRIVDEFRTRAQLIIVTHQQQTMEAADVLYGVTMETGGASQALRKEMTSVIAGQIA